MDWWLASFFLGAILSLFLPIVPDIFVLFILLLLSITFFFINSSITSFNAGKVFGQISGLLFGATWMLFNGFSLQNTWQENSLSAIELAEKAQIIQGQVLTLQSPFISDDTLHDNIKQKAIQPKDKPIRFNFSVTHINEQQLNSAMNMRFSWKKSNINIQQGQTLQLKAKFKPAHGLANLGGFSYQTWLNSKGIIATGYIVNNEKNKILISDTTTRQQLFNSYKQLLPQHELSPLLLALGFGSRTALTGNLWQVLQSTGTGHLIAISGLHIGLVASGSYLALMLLIRVLPLKYFGKYYLFQTVNIRYLVIALCMIVAFGYGYLAGFSLPTIRALVMLSLYWLTRLLAIKLSIIRWLLITLFVLTVTSPFSLFTASFWLSVYAVTVIFLTLWRFKSYLSQGSAFWRFIKALIVIQLSLTLMLLPVSAIFFQQIPLLSLLANIVAVPWMSFISIPLCLLSVLVMPISEQLSQLLMILCVQSLQAIWSYLSYLSMQSWAITELSKLGVLWLILFGLCCSVVLFVKLDLLFANRRISAVIAVITMSFGLFSFTTFNVDNTGTDSSGTKNIATHNKKTWQLIVFDVGQGLSVLIKREQQAILYDTGAAYPSGFNMVEAVVLPYLQHEGINKLDKVIISHSDNDHAGGLAILKKDIVVEELVYNQKQEQKHDKSKKYHQTSCKQGYVFYWQGLSFTVLWPDTILAKHNDDSCVLLVSDGTHKVLLTGDISKKVEAKLLKQYPQLNADILVVPHHGSKTSSSSTFLQQLSPKLAIVSAGFLNRWRMPVASVVEAYQTENIRLVNTAKAGQVIINISEQGIEQLTYRDDLWPFWFANGSQ